jgi:general secretion pathway protein G
MMNRVWEDRKSEKGFTLTELLVVIAILGILAAVVVFAVGGLNSSSQSTSCSTDKSTLQTAIDAYYATNNNTYPSNQAALVTGKLLRQASIWYDTAGGGTVTVTAAGTKAGCT